MRPLVFLACLLVVLLIVACVIYLSHVSASYGNSPHGSENNVGPYHGIDPCEHVGGEAYAAVYEADSDESYHGEINPADVASVEIINGINVRWRKDVTEDRKNVLRTLIENMVPVEGGTFAMGATPEQGEEVDSDEKPVHQVTLSDFRIARYELTQKEWCAVMDENPSNWKGDNLPVEQVCYNGCREFIKKLNGMTGLSFRLPTEAQWEYAARGGNRSRGYKYSGGNDLASIAWYWDNSGFTTHAVGTRQPNELGLYDMSGNVREWCNDLYGSYTDTHEFNPKGAASGSYRVFRGGSWMLNARCARVTDRFSNIPEFRFCGLGMRLAL